MVFIRVRLHFSPSALAYARWLHVRCGPQEGLRSKKNVFDQSDPGSTSDPYCSPCIDYLTHPVGVPVWVGDFGDPDRDGYHVATPNATGLTVRHAEQARVTAANANGRTWATPIAEL